MFSAFSQLDKAGPGELEEALNETITAREPAYLPGERSAFSIGKSEGARREIAVRKEKERVAAAAALPYAKQWIQDLYYKGNKHWGFVCLYDAATQKLDPMQLEYFGVDLSTVPSCAHNRNGSQDLIDKKWRKLHFNGPQDAAQNDGASFRRAFKDIVRNPLQYELAGMFTIVGKSIRTQHMVDDIASIGILTNTFLVIDQTCIDSVVPKDHHAPWFDDMRIRAFEADFPVPGRVYKEGYEGFTWVRIDQLVYNFYELRCAEEEAVDMDQIWKAAQKSRHGAFVSMCPGEATNWTTSKAMHGFTPESVIGGRWYEMQTLREAGKLPPGGEGSKKHENIT